MSHDRVFAPLSDAEVRAALIAEYPRQFFHAHNTVPRLQSHLVLTGSAERAVLSLIAEGVLPDGYLASERLICRLLALDAVRNLPPLIPKKSPV